MKESDSFNYRIAELMTASIAAKQNMLNDSGLVATIAKVSELLIASLRQGNKLILFGNGGSAADAQHIAAELVGRFAFDRPALPALALSVNSSCVTAIGNDYGFERVFSRQLEALARVGDVAIGISTSGTSPNVVNAILTARRIGLKTVGLTGASGRTLAESADLCMSVPASDTPRIQECHILIGHILSELVEKEIFAGNNDVSRF